jgi:hypothetical protein
MFEGCGEWCGEGGGGKKASPGMTEKSSELSVRASGSREAALEDCNHRITEE